MTAPTREEVYASLFAAVAAVPGLVVASRRIRHWTDVPPADQPALFQAQRVEIVTNDSELPPIRRLGADLYLYAHSTDPAVPPSQILNGLVDGVAAALAPEPVSGNQTLGGLVSHVWIGPHIETDEGALGDQGVAIIPVIILVP